MSDDKPTVEELCEAYAKERVRLAFGVDDPDKPVVGWIQMPFLFREGARPLDIEVVWDEEGYGVLVKENLRELLLERCRDEPEQYAQAMSTIAWELRMLADEIEAMAPKPYVLDG